MKQEIVDFIKFMGENIIPVPITLAIEKFDSGVIIVCIKNNLVTRSDSRIGLHPYAMKKVKGYMELTDNGWKLFENLENESLSSQPK